MPERTLVRDTAASRNCHRCLAAGLQRDPAAQQLPPTAARQVHRLASVACCRCNAIAANAKRFLSALDLGGDRLDRIREYDQNHRNFLSRLPAETQHQVAYRSAWSLLFGEEFAGRNSA